VCQRHALSEACNNAPIRLPKRRAAPRSSFDNYMADQPLVRQRRSCSRAAAGRREPCRGSTVALLLHPQRRRGILNQRVANYLLKQIAGFISDPPSIDFQRDYLAALLDTYEEGLGGGLDAAVEDARRLCARVG
jgi:hypothetical protein